MKLLENKTALITGASRGIGRAIATVFAQHGANIAFTYFSSEEKAKALEKELSASGIKAKGYKSNAASYEEAQELSKAVHQEFGSIDVLVNNAGQTKDNLLLRLSEEDWDAVIETNLKSIFNLSKPVSYIMLKQRKGSIINISSIVGMKGQAGQANYSASKAGIIGFTKSIADELGSRNIRSNAIAPGFIETDMTEELSEDLKTQFLAGIPLKRMGSAEEVANSALFLASDLSSYVNGQVLSVCGGLNR
ncbi:MAG: 3-oxoacyl-[acyl-carrier-protein] reductase [Chitinophagales bacterium]|nr:3-oxoacyl-[acyl-carrier-protein] reductase [Bacteroidota bacterium]MCB9257330.1 3-oxoacyl-[acyl-carrier-protein] reductase [Chitinophagales bacterium]